MAKARKLLKYLSILILILAFLSGFGFAVRDALIGGSLLGPLAEPLETFITFPAQVKGVVGTIFRGRPPTQIRRDRNFEEINRLTFDLYGLNSFYIKDKGAWEIRLFNFRNDSVLHRWLISDRTFFFTRSQFTNSEPRDCILLPGRSLIVGLNESNNLYRLDSASNIVWHNTEKLYHHDMNPDPDGNFWVCSSNERKMKGRRIFFRDDYITKVDVRTGKILVDKSVAEILIDNGYPNFVLGIAYKNKATHDNDPIHLNDIQPVMEDGPYWQKGDLLLSLRHKSLIFLYRPSNHKILRLVFGPFLNQHDVDFISGHEISFFDNNVTSVGTTKALHRYGDLKELPLDLSVSRAMIYDFADSTFRVVLLDHFRKETISTFTQGVIQYLSNGYIYVENQNAGKIYVMNENEIIYKKQLSAGKNLVERPHWIRLFENVNF